MRVLIIGFGSIGRRHAAILNSFPLIEEVAIVSKQISKEFTVFSHLEEVSNLEKYDYFVIASQTHLHFKQLEYLNSKVTNKIILVEKPIFEKSRNDLEFCNLVYVGYNLRYHPIIQNLKNRLSRAKPLMIIAKFGLFLPMFRPETDYRNCYSASKVKGGGVALDISHEIDYVQWLLGNITDFYAINSKISDLVIDSDDLLMLIGKTESGVYVNISLDYISKMPLRHLIMHFEDETIFADLNSNTMKITGLKNESELSFPEAVERNFTYEKMHQAILSGETEDLCTAKQAEITLRLIENIKTNSSKSACL